MKSLLTENLDSALTEVGIESLEELTNKEKPLKINVKDSQISCPVCGHIFNNNNFNEKTNYCSNCGQKIDTIDALLKLNAIYN